MSEVRPPTYAELNVERDQLYEENADLRTKLSESESCCAERGKCLKKWMAYFQSDFPQDAEGIEESGEVFSEAWFATDRALSTSCGTGWASPEKVKRLRDLLGAILEVASLIDYDETHYWTNRIMNTLAKTEDAK